MEKLTKFTVHTLYSSWQASLVSRSIEDSHQLVWDMQNSLVRHALLSWPSVLLLLAKLTPVLRGQYLILQSPRAASNKDNAEALPYDQLKNRHSLKH